MRSCALTVAVLATLLGSQRSPAAAQGIWTEFSTLGYGATAVGLSIGACWSCDYESFGVLVLAAGIGGLVLGHRIGGSAEGTARRGEPLRSAQLWGARIGTVTGSAAIGAIIAALIINETGGNEEGEDERRLVTYTLVGGVAGVVLEVLQESGLQSATSTVLRSVLVESTSGGATRVGLRRSVGW